MKSLGPSHDGNFISFTLGREEYAVQFRKVQEILGPDGIQETELEKPCLRGFMNLRNQKVQVLDLRCHFQLETDQTKKLGTVLITSIGQSGLRVGLLVDAICQVLHIDMTCLKPSSVSETDPRHDFLVGMAHIQGRKIALLDFERGLDFLGVEENISGA